MKVIDVSEFQGNVDYEKVKADGVEGVVIRAGYGRGNIDERFIDNISNAIRTGLHIGIYWFSYAYTEEMAKKEARFCNDVIAPYKSNIDMPVFFDWEYDSMKYAKKNGVEADAALITDMTKYFCEEIESLGYVGGYYLNLDYSKNYYDESKLSQYKRWFARYTKADQNDCYLWQYSSKGSVSGIDGNVDMNVLWGDIFAQNDVSDAQTIDKSPDTTEAEIKPSDSSQRVSEYYVVGNTYTVDVMSALNVRKGPGTDYSTVGYANLTSDGKKHATSYGALLPQTRVTCLEVCENSEDDVWIKIPSGWICAKSGSRRFVV